MKSTSHTINHHSVTRTAYGFFKNNLCRMDLANVRAIKQNIFVSLSGELLL